MIILRYVSVQPHGLTFNPLVTVYERSAKTKHFIFDSLYIYSLILMKYEPKEVMYDMIDSH